MHIYDNLYKAGYSATFLFL